MLQHLQAHSNETLNCRSAVWYYSMHESRGVETATAGAALAAPLFSIKKKKKRKKKKTEKSGEKKIPY